MRPADQRETDMMGLHGVSGLIIGSALVLGMVGWATDWSTSHDLADFGGTVSAGGVGVLLSEVRDIPEKFNAAFEGGAPAPAAPTTAGP